MTKQLNLKLFLTILISMVGVNAFSYDALIDGIYYNFNGDEAIVVKAPSTYQGNVVIPSSVNYNDKGYSVTSIGNYAFEYCTGLTSITFPNSITSIGQQAFDRCSGLTSITIPNSVTSIGGFAFGNCSNLTSVTIESNYMVSKKTTLVNYFGPQVQSYIIGNSVTSIGDFAFTGCSSLTSITIPNSVTSIGVQAFQECSSLTSVTIPNGVTSIGNSAFFGCSGLTSVSIPNSVTSIGNMVFCSCSSLSYINVDANNPKYDSRDNCNAIIETATNTLIAGCKNTVIPNSVTRISSQALDGCAGPSSIYISKNVTTIGAGAFACPNLTSINVDANNPYFDSRENCNAIIETATNTLITGCKNTVIPNSVTRIGHLTFYHCTDLTSIEIPNSVTFIGDWAFRECSNLTSIEIPKSETRIRAFTFCKCSSLTSISIPNGVKYIDEGAFRECSSLASIEIPNSVTSIGRYAFCDCSSLTSVTIPNSVTSIGESAFLFCSGLKKVIVKDITAWCGIKFGNSGTNPLFYAHHLYSDEDTEITNLVIPNSVTSIGNHSFSGCSGLTSVTIPNSVTSIGTCAFRGCSGLTSVTIPNGVTSIGNSAFYGCSGLTSVKVYAKTPPAAGDYAFPVNDNIITLYVPQGSKAAYEAADVWKNFSNIVEFDEPFTLTANDLTMVYGDDVPSFTYKAEGGSFTGTPQIVCEATSTSPVGTYPIVVSQGTIDNDLGTYVNGTLTITKAPLTITAKSYSIKQGEALPAFEAEYSGFKNSETSSVLTTQPTITTSATSASEPGTYDIVVSGASATNYDITYVKGTLTITPNSTGIIEISVENPVDVYNIQGNKVRSKATTLSDLPTGVYIVNGRKVIVK